MDNQAIPKQKNMARGIMLPGLKLYHPAIVKKQPAASTKTDLWTMEYDRKPRDRPTQL